MSFKWYTFLSETGAEVAPPHLFKHVEKSTESAHIFGRTLEVELSAINTKILSSNPHTSWPCEILFCSEKFMCLRLCVPSDTQTTFRKKCITKRMNFDGKYSFIDNHPPLWVPLTDNTWEKIHPLGWSEKQGTCWRFPFPNLNAIEKSPKSSTEPTKAWHLTEWGRSLKLRSVPAEVFASRSVCAHGLIKINGLLECQHKNDPTSVWLVKVLKNRGGRLVVCWFGTEINCDPSNNQFFYEQMESECEQAIFALHYLNHRFHRLGWGLSNGLNYKAPDGFRVAKPIEISENYFTNVLHAFPSLTALSLSKVNGLSVTDPFCSIDPPIHTIHEGLKIEALHQSKPYGAFPATITKILSDRHFVVQFDSLKKSGDEIILNQSGNINDSKMESQPIHHVTDGVSFIAHLGMPQIMPIAMSQQHGLQLLPPSGWLSDKPFTWNAYLTFLAENAKNYENIESSRNSLSQNAVESRLLREQSLSNILTVTRNKLPVAGLPASMETSCGLSSSASDSCLYSHHSNSPIPNGMFVDDGSSTVKHAPFPRKNGENGENLDRTSQNALVCFKDFFVGMKLEYVLHSSLWNPYKITSNRVDFHEPPACSATVIRVQAGLLWLLLDLPESWHTDGTLMPDSPVLVECCSTDIYPIGWSKVYGYPFIPPIFYCDPIELHSLRSPIGLTRKRKLSEIPMFSIGPTYQPSFNSSGTINISGIYDGAETCPAIYLNSTCYIGPYLCKSSLEMLPQQFGPGPVVRVMQNLLTRLINAAYKPIRVVRLFEADWANTLASALPSPATSGNGLPQSLIKVLLYCMQGGGRRHLMSSAAQPDGGGETQLLVGLKQAIAEVAEQRHENMSLVLIKARCPRRGIKVEAPFEVCSKRRAVEEFCRQVSLLLEACPFLVSTRRYSPSTSFHPDAKNGVCFGNDSILSPSPTNNSAPRPCPIVCHSLIRLRRVDRWIGARRNRAVNIAAQLFDSTRVSSPLYNWQIERFSVDGSTGCIDSNRGLNGSGVDRLTSSVRTRSIAALSRVSGLSNSSVTNSIKTVGSSVFRLSMQSASRRHCTVLVNRNYVTNLRPVSARKEAAAAAAAAVAALAQGDSESTSVAGSDDYSVPLPSSEFACSGLFDEIPRVVLESNPLDWTSADLAAYLKHTDCHELWPWLANEAVDGRAFMLLSLPILHSLKRLQWDAAVRLARHVLSVKRAFVEQFCSTSSSSSSSSAGLTG